MALGSTYNNNKQQYSPTVYSNYKMSNTKSEIDKTSISFTFWNNSLKISIAPMKATTDNSISFDFENAVAIYLNHTKARMLAHEIEMFMTDPKKYNSSGVPSGQGLITISNGSEFGVKGACLVIRKINAEGQVESSYAYQFKNEYYYSVRNYQEKDSKFDQCYEDYVSLEIEQLLTLLKTYYEAMSSAMAYSVVDSMKFDHSRINTKLELIANKLGIQMGKGGNGGQRQESYFNRAAGSSSNTGSGASYNRASVDDIANELG